MPRRAPAQDRHHFLFILPGSVAEFVRADHFFVREVDRLAKEELIAVEGEIDEILPDGRFGVTLDNQHRIICYTAGKMRRYRIRSVVGDRVHVEMTPYDLSKGRIVFRERTPGQAPGGPRKRGFRR